ncbi:uncharacterized protein LOC104893430 [Beta vulgaris subsp. vulgaris]|uniref:uncharacterized protein LOC104893430 n=1 Tax=Beta vulgaris subsp. vulgaris TaxID=3555 RepID=UPI00053F9483|nr:uncharacterized protein LOC104893430 [Beta vulgaris subsp. vulgaris]
MTTSESGPTNGGNGIHVSKVTLEEMRARLDTFRSDPIFEETPVNINENQVDIMKLMVEFSQGNRPRAKTEQEECSNMFKRFSAHKPPTYDGKPYPTKFKEWLNDMEKLFDATQCPNKWKKTAKEIRNQPGYGWEGLKEAMRNQFYPQSLQLQMEYEFIHLRMNQFKRGLNLDLQERLAANMSKSYQELYDRAINVERKMKLHKDVYEAGKRKGKSHDDHFSNNFNKKPNTRYSGNNQKQIPRCNNCGRQGHMANECRRGSDQCYRCGKPCHVIKNYPVPD